MTGQARKTIAGTLALLPNPCTTKPCLPGLALAVIAEDSERYFLTKAGGFYIQDYGEDSDLPAPGDKVLATGDVRESRDIAGNTFSTIELTALREAHTKR